ncbi:MAG: murein hydrolase activator EnvC family protein [Erythrobacter sp.]
MTPRPFLASAAAFALLGAWAAIAPDSQAAPPILLIEPAKAKDELARAAREGKAAALRAARLQREAEAASEAATRAASEAAALAAQIQQAEAGITAAQARYSLARAERARIAARLAEKQEPTARLAAALQTAARRPLALAALQPGSLKDIVHVRAVLASAVPQIRARTAALRGELAAGRAAEARAARSITDLRSAEADLRARRQQLASLEASQRLASRAARGNAVREEERALALAEQARDLDGLVDQLDRQARVRRELAALPGPILRPADLAKPLPAAAPAPAATTASKPPRLQLPVAGRTLAGFGTLRESGARTTGITLAPAAGAQVVAPARGRVAFAGAYKGFGRIVIVEHDGGWTSLVTGLARTDVSVGQNVIGGSPIGVAGERDAPVTIELRRAGTPVNPLQYVG